MMPVLCSQLALLAPGARSWCATAATGWAAAAPCRDISAYDTCRGCYCYAVADRGCAVAKSRSHDPDAAALRG